MTEKIIPVKPAMIEMHFHPVRRLLYANTCYYIGRQMHFGGERMMSPHKKSRSTKKYPAVPQVQEVGLLNENARLLTDMQNRLAQLAALQETSRAVVSTLDLNALLDLIIQQAAALLRAEGGMLNLTNQDRLEDEVVASTGSTRSTLGIKLPLNQTLSGWVTLHHQPVIVSDISKDPRTYYHHRAGNVTQRMINDAVAPLTIKDRVIGTLAVVDKMGGPSILSRQTLTCWLGLPARQPRPSKTRACTRRNSGGRSSFA